MKRQRRAILTGATGMVGGIALRVLLERPDVARVTAVGRRSTGVLDPKLVEVLHDDFADFSDVADAFADQDLALFCLGAYTGAVSDEELRRVTVDYAVSFGETLRARSPDAVFCLLSGQGADPTEKSRAAFARDKGAAEKALLEMGFSRVHLFRPGYIYPVTPRTEPNAVYRITRALYPLLRRIYPSIGISSEDLARAMVEIGLGDGEERPGAVLENRDIRAWRIRV